ncbi:MAG: flagellar hook-associated protein 3 [Deltaproteobacteria bacterium]|nr:flagellar hook-associated protein 3 [Deltaproteobacteria bacterium]
MRVTPGMIADNALYNLQKGRTVLGRLQEQITSGSIVNRPSDDPIATRQLLDIENKLEKGEQYQANITNGNLWLNLTETALEGMINVITEARKTAGKIASGSTDSTVRDNAASQLTELKKQLVDMGNTQLGDQYLFAGFKSDTSPFSKNDNDYYGTGDDISVEIDQDSLAAINITGDKLLKGTGVYGSVDILQTFDNLITAITNNDTSTIQSEAEKLDAAMKQVANAVSDVGNRLTRLDSAKTMITQNQNTLSGIISGTQEVDMIKAATELNQQQTAFEAALAATAKISQLSLLDYL